MLLSSLNALPPASRCATVRRSDGAADVVDVLRERVTSLKKQAGLKAVRHSSLQRVIDLVANIRSITGSPKNVSPSAFWRKVSLANVLEVIT